MSATSKVGFRVSAKKAASTRPAPKPPSVFSAADSSSASASAAASASAQPIGNQSLSAQSLRVNAAADHPNNGADANTKDDLVIAMPRSSSSSSSAAAAAAAADLDKPVLLRNRPDDADGDEDERFRRDVARRPNEASAADYERVPVTSFGKGLLRGMGWKEGGAVGLSNAAVVEPVEYVRRRHRLGLGAKVDQLLPQAARTDAKGRVDRRFDAVPQVHAQGRHVRRLDEHLVDADAGQIRVGADVRITSGAHKGLRALVQQLYDDDDGGERARLLLTATDRVVSVSRRRLQLYSASASASSSSRKRRRRSVPPITWVRPNLCVRVCSKSVDQGRQYGRVVRVDDVVSQTHFSVVTSSGRLVEDVTEDDVETVVPRHAGTRLVVVRGGQCVGQGGTLLQRDTQKQQAVLALGDHGDLIRTFHLDHVCQIHLS